MQDTKLMKGVYCQKNVEKKVFHFRIRPLRTNSIEPISDELERSKQNSLASELKLQIHNLKPQMQFTINFKGKYSSII